jgi:hypothetical protein
MEKAPMTIRTHLKVVVLALIFSTLALVPTLAHAGTSGPMLICGDGSVWIAPNVNGVCDAYGDIIGYQNVTAVCQDGTLSQDDPAIACSSNDGLQRVIPGGAAAPLGANSIAPVIAVGLVGSPVSSVVVAPVAPVATPSGPFIPHAGNGRGPTQCADGTVSHSSGRGTCSHHGGER